MKGKPSENQIATTTASVTDYGSGNSTGDQSHPSSSVGAIPQEGPTSKIEHAKYTTKQQAKDLSPMSLGPQPSYTSYLEDDEQQQQQQQQQHQRQSNNELEDSKRTTYPSYVSYCLDEKRSHPQGKDDDIDSALTSQQQATTTTTCSQTGPLEDFPDDIVPLPPSELARQSPRHPRQQGPGAYPIAGFGRVPDGIEERQSTIIIGGGEIEEGGEQLEHNTTNLEQNENSNEGLVQARRVSDNNYDANNNNRVEAQPVDPNTLEQTRADKRQARDKKYRTIACGFVIVACIVLTMSLAIGLSNRNKNMSSTHAAAARMPTPGPTRSPPPMENLEILYSDLPEATRESLYDEDTPQYVAWEWLLNHPSITAYPEWRKKQIFAMATFFYSFEGVHWPDKLRNQWLDIGRSECSWVLSDFEVDFFAQESKNSVGNAYGKQDYQPCNRDGQLQTLLLPQIRFPANTNDNTIRPSIPPEIQLLTNLRIVGIFIGQIPSSVKLSDHLLVPELVQLPNLSQLNLQSLGVGGTIPQSIGKMTSLRHLMIGENQLTGSLPPDIGNMTSLEHMILNESPELTGRLPSELGLLTKLTGIEFSRLAINGPISSEMGLLTSLGLLALDENKLSGAIPSQLSQLTNAISILLWNNALVGTLPTELGLLTGTTRLNLLRNRLSGSIPTQLGLLKRLRALSLRNNALNGTIPSELGLLSNTIMSLQLGDKLEHDNPNNNLWGTVPPELWELSNMEKLLLSNLPLLEGSIPTDLVHKMPNLTTLHLEGSPNLFGTIPEQFCHTIDELDFDCSDLLCGCDCDCGL